MSVHPPIIEAVGLGKCYRLYESNGQRLFHSLTGRSRSREHWALRDLDLRVERGEAVGIIGRNGSGKSTLLELIAGTLKRTTGSIAVRGRVSALLELGSGFNPEYTGRDNVFLNGAILGVPRRELERKYDEIVDFAEIGEYIDQPVKEYSSGMLVRLAFAVQVAVVPDILIVDEALSVGDIFFQQKCFKRIREIRGQGTTILFVSHDMGVVRDLCERVVYLRQGEMILQGEPHLAVRLYLGEVRGAQKIEADSQPRPVQPSVGSRFAIEGYLQRALWVSPDQSAESARTRILCVVVEDEYGQSAQSVQIGRKLKFSVLYQVTETIPIHVSIVLKNRYDQIVNCTSTYTLGMDVPRLESGSLVVLAIQMDMMLEAGEYTFFVNLGRVGDQPNRGDAIDESPWLGPISIRWEFDMEPAPFLGMFGIPATAVLSPLLPNTDEVDQ